MNRKFAMAGLLILSGFSLANAQVSAIPLNETAKISRTMFVDPSSAKVSLGKVHLIVNPLTHKGKFYLGAYQIKVVPYYFKNEKGTLKMQASEDSVLKLSEGIPMEFTGQATNNKTGEVKVVKGKATPSTIDRGSAMFAIATANGLMVFNTSYHFGQ